MVRIKAVHRSFFLISFFLLVLTVIFPISAYAGINEWTSIGPEGAQVYALAIDPLNPNILYAGTNYGVFKSTNAGTSWTDANTAFRNSNGWFYVSALAINPLNPNIVYAAGGGVFKSTDTGTSWINITPTGLWGAFPVASLAINPLNPNIIYVGGWEGLIFVSYDAGGYWFIIQTGFFNGIIESLAIGPSNPNILYAGCSSGVLEIDFTGGGITNISGGFFNGYVTALAIDSSNPDVIYAVAGTVFKSTDAGASWIGIGSSDLTPPQYSRYVRTLAIDPLNPNILYAGTNGGVFKNTNAGTSWTAMNEGLGALFVPALAIDPSNPNILYAGTEGGVFKYQIQEGPVDSDNDGLPDVWETTYWGNSALYGPSDDPDGDGLTNLEEYNYGTDPTKRDTDGDGYSDKEELDAATNPNDPNDYPAPPPDTTAPVLITNFQASDGEDAQSTLTWTNPSDIDLSQVIVNRKTMGYPTSHTDGETRLTIAYATPSRVESFVDTGLNNGAAYYYAVFSKDKAGNWNDEFQEGKNADRGLPAYEKWSFAIITDLHIGRGYLNYDAVNYEDYYLTKRLEKEVEYINNNYKTRNIKFLAVLGDITDSGQYSEFKKAKDILDNLEIPYFPVIGNHDVWNWYAWQDEKSKIHRTGENPIGDGYFNTFFNQEFYQQQFQKLGVDWREFDDDEKLQNYAFGYREINFLGLDFISRKYIPPRGEPHSATLDWLRDHLREEKLTIIFSHHPLIGAGLLDLVYAKVSKEGRTAFSVFDDDKLQLIADIINNARTEYNTKILANLAGHVHGFYDPDKPFFPWSPLELMENPIFLNANINYQEQGYTAAGIQVVTTEALMVASNEADQKGIVRLVEIEDKRISNYNLINGGGEFQALNPYFKEIEWSPRLSGFPPKAIWEVEFELYAFNKLYPLSYTLNFGDNSSFTDVWPERIYPPVEVEYNYPKQGGTYKIEFTIEKSTLNVKEGITRNITLPRWKWGPFTRSPVDIVLIDPDGLTTDKQVSKIPGGIYYETGLDENGDIDDIIILSDRKIGDYSLTVIPEANEKLTNTYTLGVLGEDDTIILLAENVQISNIPSQPYIIRSTETEIIPIIPATVDFDPDTLNLKSKGQWVTVYIELPIGHEYDVRMIDLNSIKLNGQIQAETKPTEIGDYDMDGIPDLMVKFNRAAAQNILQTGGKIKITIAGNLVDGRLFEGVDFIRMVSF